MNVIELGIAHLDPGLTFIGTDPSHERRGAASSLTRWGLDRCVKNKIPAYLESTLNAVPFYEKLGFKITERLSIELEGPVVYEEACCLYQVNDHTEKMEVPSILQIE
jgi:predicted N-acetyltransferase YhbS